MEAYPPAVKSTNPFVATYKTIIDKKVLVQTRRAPNGQTPTEQANALNEYHTNTFQEAHLAYLRMQVALRTTPCAGGSASVRTAFATHQQARRGRVAFRVLERQSSDARSLFYMLTRAHFSAAVGFRHVRRQAALGRPASQPAVHVHRHRD
jgi:hypothetical protein